MRTATPWWLTWAHLFALVLLFVAQRLMPSESIAWGASLVAVVLTIGVVGVRVLAVVRTHDSRRRVERAQLFAAIGTLVGLALYYLSTKSGMELAGQGDLGLAGAHRWKIALTVLSAAVLAASILPMVMIEATLGTARRDGFDLGVKGDDDAVEYRRVREVGLSGLTIALALGFLMVTCNVARQRNLRENTAYFKTTEAGASTRAILTNTSEPIRVLLFFPAVNEVKDEVRAYFEDLADATGKVTIEERTLVVDRKLAEQYKVQKEGAVVLVRGEGEAAKSEKFDLDVAIDVARRPNKTNNADRPTLRSLDASVNAKLMKLVREKRRAYLTVGHGEINDPDSLDPTVRGKFPDARATVIKSILGALNYEVKELGMIDGLGTKIPDDATMVLVLGPRTPLDDAELATLDAYLAGGGNVLIALDPKSDASLGPLEARLGVHFDRTSILDDKNFVAQKGPTWAITNQFSSHASITSLSKAASNEGLLLLDVGSLDEVAFGADAGAGEDAGPKRTFMVRSMTNSFRDLDGNGAFTDGTEKRDRYNVAAAIEGAKAALDKPAFRALVFGDVDLFIDRRNLQGEQVFLETYGGPLPSDAIKWVGGEEVFGGEIENENDVEIEPTKRQDSWWFLLTIVGAPLLVLSAGLLTTMKRRRPAARRSVAAPKPDPKPDPKPEPKSDPTPAPPAKEDVEEEDAP